MAGGNGHRMVPSTGRVQAEDGCLAIVMITARVATICERAGMVTRPAAT
jgi:hypothetical protein